MSGEKLDKKNVLMNCEKFLSRKGSFPYRICKLLKEGDFSEALSSRDLTHLLNEGAGKKIKVNNLTSFMEPLLKEDIVKIKIVGLGPNKRKFWIPGWIDKTNFKKQESYYSTRDLHPEIIDASAKLFVDGHYSEAIFNAFKKVEILVKNKSGVKNLTGHPLMQKVFSVKTPLLKFNTLISQIDKDEQQGMMELFAGAMLGIRNPKAHNQIIQKDSVKTMEYLSFASLLCKRLDESKK